MREWQVGDPVGYGNDIGVPDIKYMGYLKDSRENSSHSNNISKSRKYQEEAWDLKVRHKLMAAESVIDEAIRIDPNDCENWNIKGLIILQKFEEMYDRRNFSATNQAYACFSRALEIDPSNSVLKNNKMSLLYDWADALYDVECVGESIKRIDEYLAMANRNSYDYARGINLKGCALDSIGNREDALECFNMALEISPDNETFQRNQKRLSIELKKIA